MSDIAINLFWLLLFLSLFLGLPYHRVNLLLSSFIITLSIYIYTVFGKAGIIMSIFLWSFALVLILINIVPLRRSRLSKPLLNVYKRMVPKMSKTEKEALEAGGVWWEGELFSGMPNWDVLMTMPQPELSPDEKKFINGPCEKLCEMLDDWEISHHRGDLPEEIWKFFKSEKFFAMIIPKKYGGLEFSSYANAMVTAKIASRNAVASSTVGVPNSLGPAELLLHYGSEEQKNHYLPRLASGEEIPCFALTSTEAGSDASSIIDSGIICKGTWNGEEIIGIKLNWNKRYITLAPVATILGLAFKLYDPEKLIGEIEDYGITAALIPTNLDGVTIGRRHLPMNVPFQNGPTSGNDVFVPIDFIIGGKKMAGKGWKMLVECLSVGRAITLPSTATGGGQAAAYATGAYAQLRKQFNLSISQFDGIKESLARIAGYTYIMNSTVSVTSGAIDHGEKPAVPSAILKYHCTELGRKIANDAMDVHGGKAIMMGPKNYMGRSYMATPIAITVEGANILTRSLIIFGQGAIRCHPFVLAELEAANEDGQDGLKKFDKALFGHIGYAVSNITRSLILAITKSKYSKSPVNTITKRYYQHINRYSAAFAVASDFAMLSLGGELKKKELLSARLGDVLSSLYLASTVLKHYENQGCKSDDLPLVEWSVRTLMYEAQEQLHNFLINMPNKILARFLRLVIFPRGRSYSPPPDGLTTKVARIITSVGESRERLSKTAYTSKGHNNPLGLLQEALELSEETILIEAKLQQAKKDGIITSNYLGHQIEQAELHGILKSDEIKKMKDLYHRVSEILSVDDFGPNEFGKQ